MKKSKTPRRQSGGTAKKSAYRVAREAEIVSGLEKMRTDKPAAFAKMLRLLARLTARAEREISVMR